MIDIYSDEIKLPIYIFWDYEGGEYVARIPAIQGLSACGGNLIEVMKELCDAYTAYIESDIKEFEAQHD